MTWECEHYDNDDVMAELGRTLVDMLIAHRNRYGSDSDAIAFSLRNEVSQYIENEADDEPEDE